MNHNSLTIPIKWNQILSMNQSGITIHSSIRLILDSIAVIKKLIWLEEKNQWEIRNINLRLVTIMDLKIQAKLYWRVRISLECWLKIKLKYDQMKWGRPPFNYSKCNKPKIKILKNRWIFITQSKTVELMIKAKEIEKDNSYWHQMSNKERTIKATRLQLRVC